MNIWIVAALKAELALVMKELGIKIKDNLAGYPCGQKKIGSNSVRIGLVGIGVASTCLALGSFLSSEPVDHIFMVGSAGSLPGSELGLGDLIVSENEILAELGAVNEAGIGQMKTFKLLGVDQMISLDSGLTDQLVESGRRVGIVKRGNSLTVVGVSAKPEHALARAKYFEVLSENMEGYGLALAGRNFGAKTAEIRGISNRAGDRNKANWDFKKAHENSQMALLDYLGRL